MNEEREIKALSNYEHHRLCIISKFRNANLEAREKIADDYKEERGTFRNIMNSLLGFNEEKTLTDFEKERANYYKDSIIPQKFKN